MTKASAASDLSALNYQHLRYFWTVAHHGSIAAALPLLGVSQPTVTEQLHALEIALGAPLFVRRGRNRALTEHGHLVLRYADEIFTLGKELLTASRSNVEGRPLRLTIGVADSLPKLTAWRLIEPAFALGPLWRAQRQDRTIDSRSRRRHARSGNCRFTHACRNASPGVFSSARRKCDHRLCGLRPRRQTDRRFPQILVRGTDADAR